MSDREEELRRALSDLFADGAKEIEHTALLKEFAPCGAALAGLLAFAAVDEVNLARAVLSTKTPRGVRVWLLLQEFAGFGTAGYSLGKTAQAKKTETEDEKHARMRRVTPITWVNGSLHVAALVSTVLAANALRGRERAVLMGVLSLVCKTGGVLYLRSKQGRMVDIADRLTELNKSV